MTRRLIGGTAVLGLSLALTACGDQRPPAPAANSTPAPAPEVSGVVADIGGPLYEAKEFPKSEAAPAVDPIVIPGATLTYVQSPNISSLVDGNIVAIGTEVKLGEQVPPEDLVVYPYDKKNPRRFRKLKEGDRIQAGQVIVQLDDRKARANFEQKQQAVEAARQERIAASALVEAARVNYEMVKKAGTSVSRLEELRADLEVKRGIADAAGKDAAIISASEAVNEARVLLDQHTVASPISGIVQKIYKQQGEAIKQIEVPILQITNSDRLRIEGSVEVQNLSRLKPDMNVLIEPSVRVGPIKALRGHMQPITGVAVTKRDRIISASEDRTIRLWDKGNQVRLVQVPVEIRCLAATGRETPANLALSGAVDGKVRLVDLDNPEIPARETKGRHAGVVHCVAFSPDGKFCASADDREIIVWVVESGDIKYRLPPVQRGAVTALHFLPQCKLISVGRDNTLRMWALGDKAASLEKTIDRRSGDVPVLGASHDGKFVLFDQGKALHVLTLPDQRTEGVFRNPTEAGKFTGFALFSPDGKTVLTSGLNEGQMQLWRAPTATSRGSELRLFTPGDRTTVSTCAAFAPDGTFAVSGSKDGTLYVWALPTAAEAAATLTAQVSNIEASVDTSGKQARITAELNNTDGKLLPGDTVTMVATPGQ